MSSNRSRLQNNDQIQFLRDFDLLTTISPQQKPLYSASNINLAKQMTLSSSVLKQDNSKFGIGCHINQFKQFGPGIYLLFKFMKFLTIVFGLVAVLAAVSIVVVALGPAPRYFSGKNQIKSGILRMTAYNLTKEDYGAYVGINFSIAVIISIFMIYWSEKEKAYVLSCLKVTPLASYSTVILKKLPQNYNEQSLQQFLSKKFGQIAQIYTVRNFGDDLLNYKQMTEIVQQYKEQLIMTTLQPDRSSHHLSNLFFQFRNGHFKIKQQIKDSVNYRPNFAFVQFRRVEDKEKLMELHRKLNYFSCFRGKSNSAIQGDRNGDGARDREGDGNEGFEISEMEFAECQMEPGGILWENLNLTTWNVVVKTGLMVLLMVIVLSLSIFLIFLLSAVQMSVMNSKYKDLTRTQILAISDSYALLSYCTNLSFSQFYTQSQICSPYNSQYLKLTIMIFMIPLSISVFKLILTEIMKGLVIFRRYDYEIRKIQSQAFILFGFYWVVTGGLQLVVYLGHGRASVFQFFQPLIQQIVHADFKPQKITLFSDFTPNWYIPASYNITIIGAISFNLSALGILPYCKLRNKIRSKMAVKQKLQIQMNNWLKNYTLQIEYIYATLLTIVYFTLLFGGAMPVLYLFGFGSLLGFFWVYKVVFVRFCQRPLLYNHSVNRWAINMVFGAIIMHCFFTPIFYGAPGIAEFQGYASIIDRITSQWWYLLLMITLILYLLLQKPTRTLHSILTQHFNRHSTPKKTFQQQQPLPHPHRKLYTLPTIVRKKHNQLTLQLQSYSMHESVEYKDILRTLYTINNKERARKTCVLNRDLLQLYQENIKASQGGEYKSRALVEIIKLVRKDYYKYAAKYKKGRNPFQPIKQKLYKIFQNSKKSQNHKYTLCLTASNGFSDLYNNTEGLSSGLDDHVIEEAIYRIVCGDGLEEEEEEGKGEREGRTEEVGSIGSNGMRTKECFVRSNLEQVVEAGSSLEEDTSKNRSDRYDYQAKYDLNNNKQNDQPLPKPLPIIKRLPVEPPQYSDQRLRNSQI